CSRIKSAGVALKTTSSGLINVGEIAEASLIVRTSDWHPVAEHLRVKGEQGDEEFDLTETAYSVVSLTALDSKVFAGQPIASTPSSSSTPKTVNVKPERSSMAARNRQTDAKLASTSF